MKRWVIALSFFSVLALPVLLILGVFSLQNFYSPGPLKTETILVISPGQSLERISQQLASANIISQPWLFTWHVRLRGKGAILRAGEYRFPAHVPPFEVLTRMLKGECVIHQFTVPEGLTTRDIIHMLYLKDDLINKVEDVAEDGQLLPETYYYTLNDDRNVLIGRMRNEMTKTLNTLWATRSKGLPFKSPQEALILASIVEKETGLAGERPRIAGVFINRLRRGMPLQSDPTVAYGCFHLENKPSKALSHAELQKPTAYNTYLNGGLPPGPICNPGREAIQAVLQPLETEDLYFVADGTGGHVFSKTYEEHQKHHQRWRKITKLRSQGGSNPSSYEAIGDRKLPKSCTIYEFKRHFKSSL